MTGAGSRGPRSHSIAHRASCWALGLSRAALLWLRHADPATPCAEVRTRTPPSQPPGCCAKLLSEVVRVCAYVCVCVSMCIGGGDRHSADLGPTARRGHPLKPRRPDRGAGTPQTEHLPRSCSPLARRPVEPSPSPRMALGDMATRLLLPAQTGDWRCCRKRFISPHLIRQLQPAPWPRLSAKAEPHAGSWQHCGLVSPRWVGRHGCPGLGQSSTTWAGRQSTFRAIPGPLHMLPLLLSTPPSLLFGSLYSPPPGSPP